MQFPAPVYVGACSPDSLPGDTEDLNDGERNEVSGGSLSSAASPPPAPGAAPGPSGPGPPRGADARHAGGPASSPPSEGEDVAEGAVPTAHEESILSLAEQNAVVFRAREEQVLMETFGCCIQLYMLFVICIMALAFLGRTGVFVWMVIEFARQKDSHCDAPLQSWCVVTMVLWTYNKITLFGRSAIYRRILRWEPSVQRHTVNAQEQPPRRVVYYERSQVACGALIFLWHCMGAYWTIIPGSHTAGDVPCDDAAPDLFIAVRTSALFGMISVVFLALNLFGIMRILRWMLRMGVLHSSRAAPKGSLEKNTEVVSLADCEHHKSISDEPLQCSICIEDFDFATNNVVVRTKACKHAFHKTCLQGWLNVNRTCPLCRLDFGAGDQV